uniref:histidine kinase n=1 Tax=Roseihalotalea indica TaxID=2867963 RepID=A0AA49GNM6_9BACT|nr:PAS domain-containing protein [Tunicatimonas sp. TK19036]
MSQSENPPIPSHHPETFTGGGRMGERIREFDWEKSAVGANEHWSPSLKVALNVCLEAYFPIAIYWGESFTLFYNDAWSPISGKKNEWALGKPGKEVWPEIWDEIGTIFQQVLTEGKSVRSKNALLPMHRHGYTEECYFDYSLTPIREEDGKVGGIFNAVVETTYQVIDERRTHLLHALSTTSKLPSLADIWGNAINTLALYPKDIPFCLLYSINRNDLSEATLRSYTGLHNEPDNSLKSISLIHDAPSSWPFAQMLKEHQSHCVFDFGSQFETPPTGSWPEPCQQAIALPIYSKPTQLVGFIVAGISSRRQIDNKYIDFYQLVAQQLGRTITDIKDRMVLEQEQAKLLNLFEQAPVAIAILSGPNHVLEVANPVGAKLWGIEPEKVLGLPLFDAIPDARGQGFEELLNGVYHTGEPFVGQELPITLLKDGAPVTEYFTFVYHPWRDEQGRVIGIITVATGVTEQVEARKVIEAKNITLEKINADLDNFVYMASHDLKTPIANIEGLVHTLKRHLPSENPGIIQQLVEYMELSIERFKSTLTDMAHIARLQRQVDAEVKEILLTEVLAEVQEDLRIAIEKADVRFEIDINHSATIRFSPKNMRSVIYNLLSNAIKYRSPERHLQIRVSYEESAEYQTLTIEDNGLGIDPSQKNKIFTMFQRLHDHVEGTGLGLYIINKIMENTGGKIEVDSQLDVGSIFKVYFKR